MVTRLVYLLNSFVLRAKQLRAAGKSASQAFPVGTAVDIVCENQDLNGRHGKVTGNCRGRVGVELENGDKVGLPPQQLRSVGKNASQACPVGTAVDIVCENQDLNGRHGKVTGNFRGRVGVELENGDKVGLPPQQLRSVGKNASQAFPIGTAVDIVCENQDLNGRHGKVTGNFRGRVGVESCLENGDKVGLPPQQLRSTGKNASQAFPVGTAVDIVCDGVELENGDKVGLPPQQLRSCGKTARQAFPIGREVDVVNENEQTNGMQGRVVGVVRGRVGVELRNGQVVGVPAGQLKDSGMSGSQKFRKDTEVVVVCEDDKINGLVGKVCGKNRGRIGVELRNGTVIGVPPEQLRSESTVTDLHFKKGERVHVIGGEHNGTCGNVTGVTRGRIGVELSCSTKIGVPAPLLRKEGLGADQGFALGAEVEVVVSESDHFGLLGTVTGVARGRVGVLLRNGSNISVPANGLRLIGKMAEQKVKKGDFVVLATEDEHNGLEGTVEGTHRGRVGVRLLNDELVGVPAEQLRPCGKSAAQGFNVGCEVEVLAGKSAGLTGRVCAVTRGRVGVSLLDGTTVGVPAGMLRAVTLPTHRFPIGSKVQFKGHSADLDGLTGWVQKHFRGRVSVETENGVVGVPADVLRTVQDETFPVETNVEVVTTGEVGTVKGHGRGRVAVQMGDETKGLPYSTLRAVKKEKDCLPEGSHVHVVAPGSEHDGKSGKVTGHSRNRIAVELEDETKVGMPASCLRQCDTTAWTAGDAAQYTPEGQKPIDAKVTGISRGRVGIEYGETKKGVPPAHLVKKS
eukprot:TRINITY_DN1735_c0_g1_i4.p1 TRINITY_DN1735_c0_g1~~TRINITY_DN1735_c0_g1_i4.p1  ORF type:complete len:796 (+),score=178.53 TRINITY_DN1735_c0_g1_i4:212-2599(+)